jgi:hypothetical protein
VILMGKMPMLRYCGHSACDMVRIRHRIPAAPSGPGLWQNLLGFPAGFL